VNKEATKAHALSFEDVDALWAHLFEAHGIEARGGMIVLDRLHIDAHKAER
jgi:hypothetical protein